MGITILRDIMVQQGKLESYFDLKVPVSLWRAQDTRLNRHPMGLIEEPFLLPNGKARKADIIVETRGGEPWILIENAPRGLSTFDKPNAFKGDQWKYFMIPAGTPLPEGLTVIKDAYYDRYQATHYTLAPARDMPLKTFRTLLLQLFAAMSRETG
jgi:hypothetical protein